MTKEIIGGLIKVNKGILMILPNIISGDKRKDINFIQKLLGVINPPDMMEIIKVPDWIDDFKVGNEKEFCENLEIYKRKLEEIHMELNELARYKAILYLKHDELIEPVMGILNSVDIKTFREEKFEEDFWICDGEGVKKIICEVKGTKNNIARKHINNLDNHREMNELGDDFPALLISNTFAEAESISEKNREISPDIIKHAINNNILIMRSLDLINAYSLITKGYLASSDFF